MAYNLNAFLCEYYPVVPYTTRAVHVPDDSCRAHDRPVNECFQIDDLKERSTGEGPCTIRAYASDASSDTVVVDVDCCPLDEMLEKLLGSKTFLHFNHRAESVMSFTMILRPRDHSFVKMLGYEVFRMPMVNRDRTFSNWGDLNGQLECRRVSYALVKLGGLLELYPCVKQVLTPLPAWMLQMTDMAVDTNDAQTAVVGEVDTQIEHKEPMNHIALQRLREVVYYRFKTFEACREAEALLDCEVDEGLGVDQLCSRSDDALDTLTVSEEEVRIAFLL